MERSPVTARPAFRLWWHRDPLVLASASAIRAQMLRQAGIPVDIHPADIDERALEARTFPIDVFNSDAAPGSLAPSAALALLLAQAKALSVSNLQPGRLVLGADQTLALGSEVLHKAGDRAGAVIQLTRLSGCRHQLHTAACLARDGEVLFSDVSTASLTMRTLSSALIEAYVEAGLPDILSSVGCYQIEALGSQLFARIEGDHFTIQGLPLLPILDSLRRLGMLAS